MGQPRRLDRAQHDGAVAVAMRSRPDDVLVVRFHALDHDFGGKRSMPTAS